MNHTSLILILIVIALSFILGMVMMHSHENKKKKREITSEFLESKLNDCSDLTTCTLEYVNLVKFKEGSVPLLTKRSFSMIYTASIRAGIDVSKAVINVTPGKVSVHLPAVEVQSIDVDTDSLRFYDEHNALFKWNDKDDISAAIKTAREDASENEQIEKLKARAAQQAVTVVTKLIEPLIENRQLEVLEG
ncbi:MAG: DUF4230 domain-containing protein [Bulleidia sp.]|nr:DUF4230 domain-containing protein [Bulleidia sp.]